MEKMDLARYLEKRKSRELVAGDQQRELCFRCFQPQKTCYCSKVSAFDPKITFVILIHPIEARKRIATGRMTHLHLQNSRLFRGQDFSHHSEVNQIVNDKRNSCFVLFPGLQAMDISHRQTASSVTPLCSSHQNMVIFVIDGTWTTAGRTIRRSANLIDLPRIFFSPKQESRFRVRQQPKQGCVSTIEAVHQTIEILGPERGFDLSSGQHNALLACFDDLVETQMRLMEGAKCQRKRVSDSMC